jgi:hypothetical protein
MRSNPRSSSAMRIPTLMPFDRTAHRSAKRIPLYIGTTQVLGETANALIGKLCSQLKGLRLVSLPTLSVHRSSSHDILE